MRAADKMWFRQTVGHVGLPRLRKVRLSRGVGLRELARQTRVSKNTVVRAEGGYTVQSRVAVAFAEALDADILELMAPRTLSDQDVEELRRVFARRETREHPAGADNEEDEEDGEDEPAMALQREESLVST